MILKSQKKDKSRRRHPVTMVESVMVICVLFLFFFGLLQIMEWFYGFIFCQYSAYYASKGMALGYQDYVTLRAARVAAISISGPPRGNVSSERVTDYDRAENYMTHGDASGVWYQFWGNINNRSGTQLKITRTRNRNLDPHEISGRVFLNNSLLIHSQDPDDKIHYRDLKTLLGIPEYKDPAARVETIDYAHYLERQTP